MPATLIEYGTGRETRSRRRAPARMGECRFARAGGPELAAASSPDAQLDEVLETPQVPLPHRVQHRLGCERTNRAAHPPRERELFGPREPRAVAGAASEREAARSLDHAPVL